MKINLLKLFLAIFLLNQSFHTKLFGQNLKISDNEIQRISEMMNKCDQQDLFSGIVLLAKDGKVVFSKTYGYSNREKKIGHSLNTEYRLASVGKLFTIVAILKLFDEGKLSIDDTIGKYLDGFSVKIAGKVTIRHLLTMSSGFDNYMNNPEYIDPADFKTINDRLRLIKKENLLFEPGSSFRYSNSGFIILGAIIEKITHKNYSEFVRETILIPIGMKQTYSPEYSIFKNEAIGYDRGLNGEYTKISATIPASSDGNSISTAEDLLKFAIKVCSTNNIISEKAKILFFSGFDPNYKGDWNTLKSNPVRNFAWIGGTTGVSTFVAHYIKEEITVIILSNYTAASVSIGENIKSIMNSGKYNDIQKPIAEKIYTAVNENGIEFVKQNFAQWIKEANLNSSPSSILNEIGYVFLNQKSFEKSIEIFKLNTELFPTDANTWDSLAEAYMLAGSKELAIKNYEKSLELNPNSQGAIDALKQLKGNNK